MTISVAGNIARCRCGTVPASHSRGAISRNASPSLCSTALRHASDATRRAKLRSAHAANAMKCADGSALAAPRRHRRALFCTPLRNRQAATVMSFYLSNTRTHVRKARRRNRRARHVDHLDAMRQRESPSGPLSRGDVERSKSTERKRHDDQKQHASTVIIARPPARQRAARAGPAPTKRIDDRPAPLRRRIARRSGQCARPSGAHRQPCTGAAGPAFDDIATGRDGTAAPIAAAAGADAGQAQLAAYARIVVRLRDRPPRRLTVAARFGQAGRSTCSPGGRGDTGAQLVGRRGVERRSARTRGAAATHACIAARQCGARSTSGDRGNENSRQATGHVAFGQPVAARERGHGADSRDDERGGIDSRHVARGQPGAAPERGARARRKGNDERRATARRTDADKKHFHDAFPRGSLIVAPARHTFVAQGARHGVPERPLPEAGQLLGASRRRARRQQSGFRKPARSNRSERVVPGSTGNPHAGRRRDIGAHGDLGRGDRGHTSGIGRLDHQQPVGRAVPAGTDPVVHLERRRHADPEPLRRRATAQRVDGQPRQRVQS
ncbi:hypothetical protein OH687_25810 [Burkholderia anthina]|nr:hypothetical protein OH687_25810 [Burkholderia anthina]